MSRANIAREYGVWQHDGRRTRVKRTFWTYGEAMHMATKYAEDHPDLIVWLESRVVIQNDWEDVDFDYEERNLTSTKQQGEGTQP